MCLGTGDRLVWASIVVRLIFLGLIAVLCSECCGLIGMNVVTVLGVNGV